MKDQKEPITDAEFLAMVGRLIEYSFDIYIRLKQAEEVMDICYKKGLDFGGWEAIEAYYKLPEIGGGE